MATEPNTIIRIEKNDDGAITAVIATNERSRIGRLNSMGFEAAEKDGSTHYFEIDPEYVTFGKPRSNGERAPRREMTVAEKSVTKARLVLARAAKDPAWAKNNAELVAKWAAAEPEVQEKYFPTYSTTNGKVKTKASTKAKAKKAPEPEPEPEEEEEVEEEEAEEEAPKPTAKKGSLAGRLKVSSR